MSTDLIIQIGKLPTISANFDDVEKALAEMLKPYDSIVTDVATAKADRAKLNRIAKTVDDRRKAVKSEYMQPYVDFEQHIKRITAMITDASAKIDAQIKAIEGDEKEEKRARLEEFFEDQNPPLSLDFAVIFNPRWLNKTFDEKEAEAAILAAIEKAKAEEADMKTLSLTVTLTASQYVRLTEFLKTENINYEVKKI